MRYENTNQGKLNVCDAAVLSKFLIYVVLAIVIVVTVWSVGYGGPAIVSAEEGEEDNSDFQIIEFDLPETVEQGDQFTAEVTVENTGEEHGEGTVTYELIDPDESGPLDGISIGVVGDEENMTRAEGIVETLDPYGSDIETVTNVELLDVMDDYDAFVLFTFNDDELASDFLDNLQDDQGVVYLDDPLAWPNTHWADGVLRLHNVRGDPGERESITNNASGDPAEVTILAEHPIFDGVGEVGETVILNDNPTGHATWGSWFGAYSGEVLAEVDYGVHENSDIDEEDVRGPGIGVNDDENEVLLPPFNSRNNFDYITEAGEALLVNSILQVAPETDSENGVDGEVVLSVDTAIELADGETDDVELEVEIPYDLEAGAYDQRITTDDDVIDPLDLVVSESRCNDVEFGTDADGNYEVGTLVELQCMGHEETNGAMNDEYVLTNDIDATATAEWNEHEDGYFEGFGPIGTEEELFSGTFDGAGYEIENLHIERPEEDAVGMFRAVNGTIQNLSLQAATIEGWDEVGSLTGMLAGGSIANSTVTGELRGNQSVGGMAGGVMSGIAEGETFGPAAVSNSTASVDITDGANVGGLLGVASAASGGMVTISGAEATGDVSGSDEVGGLIGSMMAAFEPETEAPRPYVEMTGSQASGNVAGNSLIGGLIGMVTEVEAGSIETRTESTEIREDTLNSGDDIGIRIETTTAEGDVTAETGSAGGHVGGIMGMGGLPIEVHNSAASGEVEGLVSDDFEQFNDLFFGTGGFIGTVFGFIFGEARINFEVNNSTATGDVNGNVMTGGFIGMMWGQGSFTVANTAASGQVVGEELDAESSTGLEDNDDDNGGPVTGGLIGTSAVMGESDTQITKSVSTGDVIGKDENGYAGGLIGVYSVESDQEPEGDTSSDNHAIENVSAVGDVSAPAVVGGLVGNLSGGTLDSSFAAGTVTGGGNPSVVGGLIGENDGEVHNSYWDTTTSGVPQGIGDGDTGDVTGLDTDEMIGESPASTMPVFDLDEVWVPTDEYPYPRWMMTGLELTPESTEISTDEQTTATADLEMVADISVPVTEIADYDSDDTVVATADAGIIAGNGPGSATITASHIHQDSVGMTVVSASDSAITGLDIDGQGSDATIPEGDAADIAVVVEHTGGQPDAFPVDLTLENGVTVEESRTTDELEDGQDETVMFDGTGLSPGSYTVTASTPHDETAGDLTIEAAEPSPEPEANFDVAITETNSPLNPGETATVAAQIENTGDGTGTQTIEFNVSDQLVNESMTIAPGNTESVSFEWKTTNDDIGTHTATVASEDDEARTAIGVSAERPSFVSAHVADDTATVVDITFDQDVFVDEVAPTAGFAVSVDGSIVGLEAASADGTDVALELDEEVEANADILLSYDGNSDNVVNEYDREAHAFETGDVDNRVEPVEANLTAIDPTTNEARDNFSVDVTVEDGVIFSAEDSLVPPGEEATYEWEVGGESFTTTEPELVEELLEPGTYEASVTVIVGDRSDIADFTLAVVDETPPDARLTAAETVGVGEDPNLDASESSDNVAIADFEWEFGDGTTDAGANLTQPEYAFDEPGEYEVTVTVTDTSGNSAQNSTTITVEEDEEPDEGMDVLPIGLALLVVAALGVAGYYYMRRR